MLVALNLLPTVSGRTGGIETLVAELLPHMQAADPNIDFVAFLGAQERSAPWAAWHGVGARHVLPVPTRSRAARVAAEQLLVPTLARRLGVDVLHSPANTSPLYGAPPRVVTLQDMTFAWAPRDAPARLAARYVRLGVTRAARVTVPSESTLREMRDRGLPVGNVDVIAYGAGVRAVPPSPPEHELRRRHGLGSRPVALCVSADRPHKNVAGAIRAIGSIAVGRRPVLVLAGRIDRHEGRLHRLIAELGLDADVRVVGWVPQPELEALYTMAACLVEPSLGEGFGLPLLEAMGRGLPVISSGRGALAEVSAGAALECDPESPVTLGAAIVRVLEDEHTARELRDAGLARAAAFSWQAAARAFAGTYRRALDLEPAQ